MKNEINKEIEKVFELGLIFRAQRNLVS